MSEDEKEALDHVEQYPNSHNWTMVRTLALCVRRLLSSTPPDPSSAAKDAVIEAAKKWRSKHNGNRMLSHEDDLSVAVDRLAALDQEKP